MDSGDSRDFDDQLISAVQKYRVLYDKLLKDFKNVRVKANATVGETVVMNSMIFSSEVQNNVHVECVLTLLE